MSRCLVCPRKSKARATRTGSQAAPDIRSRCILLQRLRGMAAARSNKRWNRRRRCDRERRGSALVIGPTRRYHGPLGRCHANRIGPRGHRGASDRGWQRLDDGIRARPTTARDVDNSWNRTLRVIVCQPHTPRPCWEPAHAVSPDRLENILALQVSPIRSVRTAPRRQANPGLRNDVATGGPSDRHWDPRFSSD